MVPTAMKANRPNHTPWDQHAKLLQERIILVEKHFSELCSVLGNYTRKVAGLRDKNDDLAKALQNYSNAENVNKCLQNGLLEFSNTLDKVGDRRDVQVQQMETMLSDLTQYVKICKHAKEEVKNTLASQEREISRKKQLDRIRERNPRNRPQITAAQVELSKATMEVVNNKKWLQDQMDEFEKKKLQDIKAILLNYVTVELAFHAKALELYTKGYKEIANIDVDKDLEDYHYFLRDPESSSRLETVKKTSLRKSIANLFTTPSSVKGSKGVTEAVKDTSKKEQDSNEEYVQDFEDDASVTSETLSPTIKNN